MKYSSGTEMKPTLNSVWLTLKLQRNVNSPSAPVSWLKLSLLVTLVAYNQETNFVKHSLHTSWSLNVQGTREDGLKLPERMI